MRMWYASASVCGAGFTSVSRSERLSLRAREEQG